MLSSSGILAEIESGRIEINEFNMSQLNPNSYDVRLWNWFYLLLPQKGIPHYYGPLFVDDGIRIFIPSGMTLLGATKERIYSHTDLLVQLRSKSTTRRSGITVCDDAGFGDIGYNNHWTVELTAHAPGGVYLTVGERFAQVLFQRAETPPIEKYTGQYTANEWPQCMIPRKYRNFEHMHRWAEIPSFAIFDMDWVAGN